MSASTVKNGEFVVYLGPSGCGKTTTLRCIAGLVKATSGDVLFDGNARQRADRQRAQHRDGVPVRLALSASQNRGKHRVPAEGARRRRGPKSPQARLGRQRSSALATSSIAIPAALPPGARQKVALARAVIRDPAVLLLDEPLSAIDEQFREEMRWELGHLQRELGVTTIYVTHDQREAMSLADRIVLMSDGRIVQVGDPDSMFLQPEDVFAGQFIGSPSMNLIDLVPVDGGLRLGDSGVTLTPAGNRIPQWAVASGRKLKLGVRPLNVHLVEPGSDPTAFPVAS